MDNLFVFLMIFDYFKVPEQYTQRVLKWGILTALALRAVMIGVGVAVVQRFRPVLLVFALVLVVSAIKMLMPEHETDLADNAMMKIATRSPFCTPIEPPSQVQGARSAQQYAPRV